MSKKLTFTLTAIITTLSLTIFSLSNAFALENSGQEGQDALTSVKQLCKELKASSTQTYKNMKAKGLTGPLTKEELDKQIKDHRAYIQLACKEAQDTSKICTKLRKGYKQKLADLKAQNLPKEEEDAAIAILKAEIKASCDKVVTLTSPAKICSAMTNYLTMALSSSISKEFFDKQYADDIAYKKIACKEAKTEAKIYQ